MHSSDRPDGIPCTGRLLGLDFGTKRLGVAISTAEQTIASPLESYTCRTPVQDGRYLFSLVQQYLVVGVVVGLPVHMSGDEGGKAREAREFGAGIGELTGLPVQFWDERFTSLMADQLLQQGNFSKSKRKARRDKLAAQLILQSFLDSDDRSQPPIAL